MGSEYGCAYLAKHEVVRYVDPESEATADDDVTDQDSVILEIQEALVVRWWVGFGGWRLVVSQTLIAKLRSTKSYPLINH